MHLQRRAIVRQKVGFLHFLLFQSKNYKYGTTSRVSKHAICRVCGRYSRSQRNREPVYKCSEFHLSSTLPITCMDTVHLSNFCKPCHIVVHTYMKALNEGKVYKYSTVMFSGWGPHLEDRCSTCEHVKSLQLGGRPKRKAGSGRPSIKDINTVISHLECIAPYPLVPYTSIMPTALDKQLSK